VQKTRQTLEETLFPMLANATLAYGGQKSLKYRLKNKFTLSSSETSHPSIVVDFRTLFTL
jgi:hypothetical protein